MEADPVTLYRDSFGSLPTRASQLISFSKSCTDLEPLSYIAAQQLVESHNQTSGTIRWPSIIPALEATEPESDPLLLTEEGPEGDLEHVTKVNSLSPPESMSSPTLSNVPVPESSPMESPLSPEMTPEQERVQRRMNKYARHIQQFSGSLTRIDIDIKIEDPNDATPGHVDSENEYESDSENTKKRKRLRKRVVDELASTEKTYLHNLERLFSYFVNPLINGDDKNIKKLGLSRRDHNIIFPPDLRTIRGLHIQLNADLIKATDNWDAETSKVGCILYVILLVFTIVPYWLMNHLIA